MNLIHHKLRSRRGASISFALLLFLVCAVVGSVVLVAGTAAAGRISQAAEADQRYYSVTSAAELLKGQIEGDMNRVVITQEDTTPITDGVLGTTSKGSPQIGGTVITPPLTSITQDAAYHIWKAEKINNKALTLTATEAGTVVNGLAVNINETMEKKSIVDGLLEEWRLTFTLSDTGTQPYKLTMTFQAQVDKDVDYQTAADAEIKTTTQTVTWSLVDIRPVGGAET